MEPADENNFCQHESHYFSTQLIEQHVNNTGIYSALLIIKGVFILLLCACFKIGNTCFSSKELKKMTGEK